MIVAMGVEGYDEVEAAELEKATQDLQQMIADGQVGEIRMDEIIGELLLLTSHKLRTESRERVQKYEIVIMVQGDRDTSPQFLYCVDISPEGSPGLLRQ